MKRTKKIEKGKYEHTAPNGSVWIIENWGYGRGFGSVRWVAIREGTNGYTKGDQHVQRTLHYCIHRIDITERVILDE